MADTVVEGSADSSLDSYPRSNAGPFWISPAIGALVFINSSGDLTARKTEDSGAGWGSQIVVEAGTVQAYSCWFDPETPGNTGDLISVLWVDQEDNEIKFATFDVSGGTWSTPVTVDTVTPDGGRQTFITKSRNGRLVAGVADGFDLGWFGVTSTDGGANWSSCAHPFENINDRVLGMTCNTGDDNDVAVAFGDAASDEITIKVYDQSSDAWNEAVTVGSAVVLTAELPWAIATRVSDGHAILAAWTESNAATGDLKVWDCAVTGPSTASATAKTNVLTDTEAATAAVFVDQLSDDIYVAYVQGTSFGSVVGARYKKSTDGGVSWGSQETLSEDADDDLRYISGGAISPTDGGRFQPWWFNDDLNDIVVNINTDVELAPSTGVSIPVVQHFRQRVFA